MPTFSKKETEANKTFSIYYSDVAQETFGGIVKSFFESNGYALKEGDSDNGTYEKGNRVLRILLGAMYKYYKFKIYSEYNGDGEAKLTVVKATSGMSGGAIGVSQVKKEIRRLENELQHL